MRSRWHWPTDRGSQSRNSRNLGRRKSTELAPPSSTRTAPQAAVRRRAFLGFWAKKIFFFWYLAPNCTLKPPAVAHCKSIVAAMANSSRPFIQADGTVQKQGKGWSLSAIPDMFWSLANTVVIFFQTLISPEATTNFTRGRRSDGVPGVASTLNRGSGPLHSAKPGLRARKYTPDSNVPTGGGWGR